MKGPWTAVPFPVGTTVFIKSICCMSRGGRHFLRTPGFAGSGNGLMAATRFEGMYGGAPPNADSLRHRGMADEFTSQLAAWLATVAMNDQRPI